jgi:hypothetical protein
MRREAETPSHGASRDIRFGPGKEFGAGYDNRGRSGRRRRQHRAGKKNDCGNDREA